MLANAKKIMSTFFIGSYLTTVTLFKYAVPRPHPHSTLIGVHSYNEQASCQRFASQLSDCFFLVGQKTS